MASVCHNRYSLKTKRKWVDDGKAYLEKAGSVGGKMLVPPVAIPTGTYAWFADPEGTMIGQFQDKT